MFSHWAMLKHAHLRCDRAVGKILGQRQKQGVQFISGLLGSQGITAGKQLPHHQTVSSLPLNWSSGAL